MQDLTKDFDMLKLSSYKADDSSRCLLVEKLRTVLQPVKSDVQVQ